MASVLTVEEGELPKSAGAVVVGPTLAERQGLTLGSRITIGDETKNESVQKFRVVGILKQKGMSMDLNSDNGIIMTEKSYVGDCWRCQSSMTRSTSSSATSRISTQQKRQSRTSSTARTNVVTIQDSSRMLESITSTVGTLTTFVMAIAGHLAPGCRDLDLQRDDDVGDRADPGDRYPAQHRHAEKRDTGGCSSTRRSSSGLSAPASVRS